MSSILWAALWANAVIALAMSVQIAVYARRSTLSPAKRRTLVAAFAGGLFGWIGLVSALAAAGAFQSSPTRAFPAIAVGLGAALAAGGWAISRSASLKVVIQAIPLPWLIGIQLYRVVGGLFLLLYGFGQIPGEFAIPAGGGDMVVGLAAPIVAVALHRGVSWARPAAFVWSVFGIGDLVVAVATGFLSSPGPLQMLALDTPNYLVTGFPLVLVPLFAVPLSILLHIAALKRLSVTDGGSITARSSMKVTHAYKSAAGAVLIAGVLAPGIAAAQVIAPAKADQAVETLPLTLEEAVRRAIENNPDLSIVRLEPDVEAARVAESRSAFIPMFSTTLGRSSAAAPASSALAAPEGLDVDDWFSTTGVRQRLPWGSGTWSVAFDTSRTATNNPIAGFEPSLQSGVEVAFSQPLLRDRAIDPARHQYAVAKRNQQSSDLRFREAVVQTIAAVKQAYWTLKATRANIDVQQRSLELAQELARQNKVRVDAGQIPPLDLVQAQAEVAQRRENLIRARTIAGDAEDVLRRLIVRPDDGLFWQVRIDPVEGPTPPGVQPDVESAVARAINERYDLARAGHDLETAVAFVNFYTNQRLPDVRLETSYRSSGLGGTQLLRSGGFPGQVVGTRRSSLADALGQVFTSDYPSWSVGVTVSYPLGRSFEEASLARSQVERQQALQRIKSLRLEIAEKVRRAGRQISSAVERVDAARAGATLAEERLAAETKRFDAGLSTTFLVTQAQRDLLEAQVNLLQTMLDHESALVNFEAIQQAPALSDSDPVGVSGARIVSLPPSAPRGLFRPGIGF